MTTPNPSRLNPYSDRMVGAARAIVAEPHDLGKRAAFMRATFNLDWTAAAIIRLADQVELEKAPLSDPGKAQP